MVDLALQFLGSTGLSVLVEIQQNAEREQIGFGVVATSSAALHPLELSGLASTLPLFSDAPAAFQSLRKTS